MDYSLLPVGPVWLALAGTCFTWLMTGLGASAVFLFKSMDERKLRVTLGFAGGVMIAASFWSLLLPAIERSQGMGVPAWLPPLAGFALGAMFLWLTGRVVSDHGQSFVQNNGIGSKNTLMLMIAMTVHNIPEGLAVGVAFGAAASGAASADLAAAMALAIGIGIQDFPEGMAISMPLYGGGMSRLRSFWYGQLSGFVEVLAGVAGAVAVLLAQPLLPYALSFAAGAMIFVVANEIIPETKRSSASDLPTMGLLLGFAVMMVLDVGLG